jgi:putative transposase
MVAALASRELGRQVNRKRAQRVMRQQRLVQRHRPLRRRRRPGFFRVERPDQLWHLDMTAIWVAEHEISHRRGSYRDQNRTPSSNPGSGS